MASHGMAVLLPLIGGRPTHNPSHLVSHKKAPQSLEEAPVTMIVLGHLDVYNCSLQYL